MMPPWTHYEQSSEMNSFPFCARKGFYFPDLAAYPICYHVYVLVRYPLGMGDDGPLTGAQEHRGGHRASPHVVKGERDLFQCLAELEGLNRLHCFGGHCGQLQSRRKFLS